MKTALAIVCILLLVWTNSVLAQAPETSVVSAAASCHCGKKTNCCAAHRSLPESSPVSATPVFSFQNQLSLLAPAIVAWTIPAIANSEVSFPLTSSSTTTGAPLFARNCAWLI
jgi:hypothetical protein